jgi:AAA+ ATPase superfamily predicted ATPase
MEKLIGREEEKKLFQEALKSKTPELIAVYGRSRAGNTILIRQVLQKEIVFEFIGTKEANQGQQTRRRLNHK